ncbi:MAG: LCP family protein [Erysipelotrichaceae bacterium]|jgi:LCP family protein required for cell wall assembly
MTQKKQLTPRQRALIIKKRKKRKLVRKISLFTFFICLASVLFLFFMTAGFRFLPSKYLIILAIVSAVIMLFFALIALIPNIRSGIKIFQSVLCSFLAVIMIVGIIILPNYLGRLERIFVSVPSEGSLNINVYVLNDSGFENIEDLAGKLIGVQQNLDLDYQSYAIKVVNKEIKGADIEVIELENIYSAVEKLYAEEVDAIMLNQDYVDIIKDNNDFSDFDNKVKMLYQCTQKITIVTDTAAVSNITGKPFIIALTGVDQWNYSTVAASARVRSDVNIVLVVNPVNKQILMITLPRDSYVPLNGNNNTMDKLTHATTVSNGIKCWINTLNEVLDIDINYYLRVNFASLVDIINAIDGIDVNNPYYFETRSVVYHTDNTAKRQNKVFEKGLIHLNGEEALAYCRERYYVKEDGNMIGDLGRNKHQAIILKATIDKMSSVSIITRIGKLLESLDGKFTTNISIDEIYHLAQMQLDEMADWSVVTYSVTGYSAFRVSYIMGSELSMVILNKNNLQQAKQYILQILDNQIVEID